MILPRHGGSSRSRTERIAHRLDGLVCGDVDGLLCVGESLGVGAGLISLCHLPITLAIRVLLVVAAGLILAMWRVEEPAPFWPVLGSMFMFRLIVYLYDLRHERSRPPLAEVHLRMVASGPAPSIVTSDIWFGKV